MPWIPTSATELLAALDDGTLPHESSYYEYKRELPVPNKAADIAVDVCAMTVDGGLIIYGVGEDKEKVTFYPSPIPLQGAQERISNTIEANLQEVPLFDVRLLPSDEDTAIGYVLVDVPPSPRAPHMVEVKSEHRYYGRLPGRNRILSESEVARLYARREAVERDAQRVLDDAIAVAPFPSIPGERGDLHLVARPLLSDSGLRQRVFEQDDGTELRQAILDSTNALRFAEHWQPDLSDTITNSFASRSLDGVVLTNPPFQRDGELIQRYTSRLEFLDDGTTRYFRADLANMYTPNPMASGSQPVFVLLEPAMAQMSANFVLMVGQLLHRGQYRGQVDLYIALTGAKGAESASWYLGRGYERYFLGLGVRPTVPDDDFRDRTRTTADKMLSEPTAVADQLVSRLARLIRPPGLADPLRPPDSLLGGAVTATGVPGGSSP